MLLYTNQGNCICSLKFIIAECLGVHWLVPLENHPAGKKSEFIDFQFRLHIENLSPCPKDTTDYLNKTPSSNLSDDFLIGRMDVTTLYINIPHDEGITTCSQAPCTCP